MGDVVVEEFPQEERDPVFVKEGQGAVLLCAPPKAWPGTYRFHASILKGSIVKMTIPTYPCASVSFSFTEEVTYRWIYNEFPVFLPTDRRRFVSQRTGNLYISKVEAQDAGNYSCFVSSPIIGKSVFSKFIPLIPLPPDDGQWKNALPNVSCRAIFRKKAVTEKLQHTISCFWAVTFG